MTLEARVIDRGIGSRRFAQTTSWCSQSRLADARFNNRGPCGVIVNTVGELAFIVFLEILIELIKRRAGSGKAHSTLKEENGAREEVDLERTREIFLIEN